MEQLDLFAWPDCGRTMYEAHAVPDAEERTPDFNIRQARYTHAAFGNSGAIGGALFPTRMSNKVVGLYEFIIQPSLSFQRKITEGQGDVRDYANQQYLYNLYLHTETVALMVRDFMQYAERMGPMSALHVFTAATIYESRLLVYFADGQPVEDAKDRDEWLNSIRSYFGPRRKFTLKAEKTLFTK